MTDTPTVEQRHRDEALRLFINAAYPVAIEINPRGHNWSEAYLDQALAHVRARTQQPRPDASVDGLAGARAIWDAAEDAYDAEMASPGSSGMSPEDCAASVILAALTTREAVVEECARAAYRRNPFLDCHEDSPNYGLGAPRTDFDRGRERGREEAAAAIRALAAKDVAS